MTTIAFLVIFAFGYAGGYGMGLSRRPKPPPSPPEEQEFPEEIWQKLEHHMSPTRVVREGLFDGSKTMH